MKHGEKSEDRDQERTHRGPLRKMSENMMIALDLKE
jgi:hypothetical protein